MGMLQVVPVLAHPLRTSGVVVSVLQQQREVVVRCDAGASTPSVAKLFRLPSKAVADALRPGDRIIALVDDDAPGVALLDAVRVVPQSAPAGSIIRVAQPLKIGDAMPATRFTDQSGRPFTFADFHGKFVVLSFIYTRCRDSRECPLISSNFRLMQERFANGPYHLVEMTLDPGYDRPAVLARYGKRYGADFARWTLGTGDPKKVLDFAARFGIDPFADPQLGLIHTERTALIDETGKISDFIDEAAFNPSDVAARVEAMAKHGSNPLAWLDFELSKYAVSICGDGVRGFSGIGDLAIVLVIFGAAGWLLQRLARKVFFADQS